MKKENKEDALQVTRYGIGSNACYLLKETMKCYPFLLVLCVISVVIGIVIPVITTFLPKIVIEQITAGAAIKEILLVTVTGTGVLALCAGGKVFFEKLLYFQKIRMNTHYTELVAIKGMTADYCHQETEGFRKLHTESAGACNGNYSPMVQVYDVGIGLCTSGLGFVLYFGILARLSVVLVVFLIGVTICSCILNHKAIRFTEKHRDEKVRYQQRTDYLASVSGDIKSAKDIRLYHMNGWLSDVYRKNVEGLNGWYRRYTKTVFGVAAGDSALALVREIAAYAYLLYMVMEGNMGVADFVLYFGVITGFSAWLSGMFGQVTALSRISSTVNYVRTFLAYPATYTREGGRELPKASDGPKELSLWNVSYRYEGAEQDTISGLTLTVAPKEHLAIVGLNGAGKTTLVKLLCGLTNPTEGSVRYDSVDVKEYNRDSYYELFSAVFQQFSLLPVTFAEAVAEEEPARIDRERVEECLKIAGLWEKIDSLPNGMDSEYSRAVNDEGTELSGGQIQKLLLARALYRKAPIMILDEPTAALDPIAESNLYETYHEVMKDCSTVFISHRLASTRFCDRIVLMEEGKIIEEGTHTELLAKRGRYYELYETQAKYYRETLIEVEGGVSE
ncbi:MAG: ABC transporter ATP-binding protein [Lachnospiraceae bacterium]|nr:ABC transporter ATP-binding protein [Lachnospiraceae bacterium]